MKNPRRIPMLIEKLGNVWIHHPELRLCQLLIGVCKDHLDRGETEDGVWLTDPFHVTDGDLEKELDRWLEEAEEKEKEG